MVAAPGLEGVRTVDAILQPPDVLPTLLELAGVEIDPAVPPHGRSSVPLLRGQSDKPIREFAISADAICKENGAAATRMATPVLYTRQWAYAPIGPRGERELFDLRADPLAYDNVAGHHPDVAGQLHEKLLAWLRQIDAPARTVEAFY